MISKFVLAKANIKNIQFLKKFRAEDDNKTSLIINTKKDDIELNLNDFMIKDEL